MLVRFDPFRDFDRLWEAANGNAGATARSMPMNAVRRGDRLVVTFDLPGVAADAVDLTVERNQLTVTAERPAERHDGEEWLVAERPIGRFSRQILLGESLDTERIEASFASGVLEITIPVAEQAKPRKIAVADHDGSRADAIEATSTQAA